MIVVNAGYRLAPEYKHPAGEIDAYATIMWVFDNLQKSWGKMRIDPK